MGRRRAAAGWTVAQVTLLDVPAVIVAPGVGCGLEVDLLLRVLPDVTNEQITAGTVERPAPGVAQAIGPDLLPHGRVAAAVEWVGGRDDVSLACGWRAVHVEAQHLAQQRADILRVVVGVAAAAAIACAPVERAI